MTNNKARTSNSPRRVRASKQFGYIFSLQAAFTNSIASLKLLNGVKAQSPNDKTKTLIFKHLGFNWPLDFEIWTLRNEIHGVKEVFYSLLRKNKERAGT